MCEEGGHGKELYRPLLRGGGPGPCGAQERRADGAAISEQRLRQLRRKPDEKEYARLGIPRRQLQGGHRGQHRRTAPAEPRRLHGRAGGGLGPENAAHERGGGRLDASAADRRRIFGLSAEQTEELQEKIIREFSYGRTRRSAIWTGLATSTSCNSSPTWAT